MTPARVAGADLSISQSGVATGGGDLVTIKAKGKGYARLRPMALDVVTALGHAELVVIEGYDHHPLGAIALIRAAEVGGWVRASLLELGVAFIDVPPSLLKKYATGKGNAKKPAMVDAARAAGANPNTPDEADAYWLRRVGLALLAWPDESAHPPELEELAVKTADVVAPLIARHT